MRYAILLIMLLWGAKSFSQSQKISEHKIDEVPKSTPFIDSIKIALRSAKTNHEVSELQFELFREYIPISIDSSEYYVDQSLNFAMMAGDSERIVYALHGKGGIFKSRGDYKESIRLLEKALEIAIRNKLTKNIKFLYNNLAIDYVEVSDFNRSLNYHFESLKIREIENRPMDISITLNNIGVLQQEMGNYDEALIYFKRCYDLLVANRLTYGLVDVIVNIGSTYNDQNQYVAGKGQGLKALSVCDSIQCEEQLLIVPYGLLGESLFNLGKLDSASIYFNQSIELANRHQMSMQGTTYMRNVCFDYYWLSRIEMSKGNYNPAIEYLGRSHQIARKAGLQKRLARNYELYSKIFYARGEYKRSIDSLLLFQKINSEILNATLIQKISRAQSDFDNRIREAKLKDQEAILKLQKETIDQQQTLNLLTGAVAILTLSIIFILIRMVIRKQKTNELLDLRVRERTRDLELSRDDFRHANEEKIFVLENVHQGLQSSLATLKGLSHVARNEPPQEQSKYYGELESVTEKMVEHVRQYIPQAQTKT